MNYISINEILLNMHFSSFNKFRLKNVRCTGDFSNDSFSNLLSVFKFEEHNAFQIIITQKYFLRLFLYLIQNLYLVLLLEIIFLNGEWEKHNFQ